MTCLNLIGLIKLIVAFDLGLGDSPWYLVIIIYNVNGNDISQFSCPLIQPALIVCPDHVLGRGQVLAQLNNILHE